MNKIGVLEVTNKLGCYSVQLDSSWERGAGAIFLSSYSFFMSSLSFVQSFNFLLCLQKVKKFVVWWLKPILVFSA